MLDYRNVKGFWTKKDPPEIFKSCDMKVVVLHLLGSSFKNSYGPQILHMFSSTMKHQFWMFDLVFPKGGEVRKQPFLSLKTKVGEHVSCLLIGIVVGCNSQPKKKNTSSCSFHKKNPHVDLRRCLIGRDGSDLSMFFFMGE